MISDKRDEFKSLAETYDWTEQTIEDIDFWLSYTSPGNKKILEIGTGTGRVAMHLIKHCQKYVALDISVSMLEKAKQKIGEKPNIEYLIGDIRNLRFPNQFDLIIAPGRVFEHFYSDEDRNLALQNCYSHLIPDGQLILHVFGPPQDNKETKEFEKIIPSTTEHDQLKFSYKEVRDFTCNHRYHYFEISELGGRKRKWKHEPLKLRWFTPEELDNLSKNIGFITTGRFNSLKKEYIKDGSINLIWELTK